MRSIVRLAAPLLLVALGGCASSLTAIFERSVSTEDFDEREPITRVLTMTGERRTVLAVPRTSKLFVCAETLPDVARSVAARSMLELQQGDRPVAAFHWTARSPRRCGHLRPDRDGRCGPAGRLAALPGSCQPGHHAPRLRGAAGRVGQAGVPGAADPPRRCPAERERPRKAQPPRTRQQQGRSGQSGTAPADSPPAPQPGTGDTTRKPGG